MRRAVAYPFMEALLRALEPHVPEQTALALRGTPARWVVVPLHGQPPPRQVGPNAYEGSGHMIWPLGGVGAPLLPPKRAIRSAVIDMTQNVQDLIHELGEEDWPFPDAEVRASVDPTSVRVWFTSPDRRQTLDLPTFPRTLFQDAAGREQGYTSVRESFAPVALLAALLSPFKPNPDLDPNREQLLGMPRLMLTTTDPDSHEPMETSWPTPIQDGESFVLVPSYALSLKEPTPGWFRDIQAHPAVRAALYGRAKRSMIARVATAAERAELWPQVIAVFPHYGGYRYHGLDENPLVILEPPEPTPDR